jgi:hypothetical protein
VGLNRSKVLRVALPALLIAGVAYYAVVKTRLSRWGATDEEMIESLPGDTLVTRPDFTSTRAFSIHAPVEAVWSCLARDLKPGDNVSLYPKMPPLKVAAVMPGQALVLGAPGSHGQNLANWLPHVSWAFVLRAGTERNTRLIVRFRADYRADWSGSLLAEAIVPVEFLRERKAVDQIRRRAETVYLSRQSTMPGPNWPFQ